MPIYEFKCDKCKIVYECMAVFVREEWEKPCPKCGKMNDKIISKPTAILKDGGVGWSKDGYSRKHTLADGPDPEHTKRHKSSGRSVVPVRNVSIEPDKDHSKKKRPKLKVL